jgi:type II secretory pathway pseudopilin PulG
LTPPKKNIIREEKFVGKPLITEHNANLKEGVSNKPFALGRSPSVTSAMSERKMVNVNPLSPASGIKIQSNMIREREQMQKANANKSAELISLDDDDDIVEVVRQDEKKNDSLKRINPTHIMSSTNRKVIVPVKRKDPSPIRNKDPLQNEPPAKKRLDMSKLEDMQQLKTKSVEINARKEDKAEPSVTKESIKVQNSPNKNLVIEKAPAALQKRSSRVPNPPAKAPSSVEVKKQPMKNVLEKTKAEKESIETPAVRNKVEDRKTRGSISSKSAPVIEKVAANSKNEKSQPPKKNRDNEKSESDPVESDKKDKQSVTNEKNIRSKEDISKSDKLSKKNDKVKPTESKKDKLESNDKANLLPDGWRREQAKRTRGASSDKPEIYIFSKDGKRFRSKTELQKYCKENPKSKIAKVDLDSIYAAPFDEKE